MVNQGLSILFSSLWILGAALLLAALSYYYDESRRDGGGLRQQWKRRSFQLAAWMAFFLIGVGLAGTSSRLWETVVWILFATFSLAGALTTWRAADRNPAEDGDIDGN